MGVVFDTVGPVSDEKHIGRDEFINDLRESYLEDEYRTAISIVGIKKIGKTSLALNIFKNIPEDNNIIFIYEDLALNETYMDLWRSILLKISDYLRKNNLRDEYLEKNINIINTKNIEWNDFISYLKDIFENIKTKKLCNKIIIILDNFDKVAQDKDSGKNGLFESKSNYWMIFRTIFSAPYYNVSAMTISRKSLTTLEENISSGSKFSGIFEEIYLPNFDDDDMEKYYKVFDTNKIKLDDKQREKIEYYCGRFPYMLSIIGKELLKLAKKKENIDIEKIYQNKKNLFDKYYKDIKKYLEEEKNHRLDKPKYFEEHESEFVELKETTETTKYRFSIPKTEIPKTEAEWKELIAKGEGPNIEFKSSIQYPCGNKKNETIHPYILQHECMKTIAAFLNTDGGKLFIGVEDKGKILGIDNDYSTFVSKLGRDKDGFQKNLMNIFIKFFGENIASIVAENITLEFPIIDEKEICAVFVSPSSKPIYTMEIKEIKKVKKDTEGNIQSIDFQAQEGDKVFYVRTASSTRKLNISEVTDYINSHKHFKK